VCGAEERREKSKRERILLSSEWRGGIKRKTFKYRKKE